MSKQYIEINQLFNAPVETIFSLLTDHESFGKIIKTKIKRKVNSREENKNGVGSVRRVNIFPLPSFEESVITFEKNKLMEYIISKGSPIKNHIGRMEFSEEQGKTNLKYIVEFQPRLPFCFLGNVIKKATAQPLIDGLARLAEKYDTEVSSIKE